MINHETLLRWPIPEVRQSYTKRDAILYALGVGFGADPEDRNELRFVYEEGLQASPTMSLILGYPGLWLSDPAIGANWKALLHAEQSFTIFQPLPVEGTVVGKSRVTDVIDKGSSKGLFVFSERDVFCESSGQLLCRLAATSALRRDGGGGGLAGATAVAPPPHPIPDRPADAACDLRTLPQAALIYRLSGDYNPLHADPEVAASAGFPRPILHGMCTFGIAGRALLRSLCSYRPERLLSMGARFTAPVYPGETVRTEMWQDGEVVSFRCTVVERNVIALNHGKARIAGSRQEPAAQVP